MRECEEDDAKGMFSDIEGVQSLGGREMSRSKWDRICVCVVVVVVAVVLVVVVALIVAMGVMRMAVLMVVVGIVALVMVVRVACIGVVGVVGMVGVLCIGVLEVDCVGVVDIFVFGAVFVVEVVEGVELVVGCVVKRVVRLVLWCVNGRGYLLSCFRLKLVEMSGINVWVGFSLGC